MSRLFYDGGSGELLTGCLHTYFNLVQDSAQIRQLFLGELPILERLYQKLYHSELSIRIYTVRLFAMLSEDSLQPLTDSFLNHVFLTGLKHLLDIAGSKTSVSLAIDCCANCLFDGPEGYQMIIKHPITIKILEIAVIGTNCTKTESSIAHFLQSSLKNCPPSQIIPLLRLNLIEIYLRMMHASVLDSNRIIRMMLTLEEFIRLGASHEHEYSCNLVMNELNNRQELVHDVMNAISEHASSKSQPELLVRTYNKLEAALGRD
jgi:hypothetical protein